MFASSDFLSCVVFRHTEHNGRLCRDPAFCLPALFEKRNFREQAPVAGLFSYGDGVGWDSYGGYHPGYHAKGIVLPEGKYMKYCAWY